MARASVAFPELVDLVRQLHGVLMEGMQLEHCLRVLAPLFGSHITGLNTNDLAGRWASYPVIVGEVDNTSLRSIANEYEAKAPIENLWMNRSAHGYRSQGYQYGEAVVTDSELLGSSYYLDYLKPAGIRHGMAICLDSDGSTRFTAIALNRSAAQGPFGEREFRLVRALRPHLVNLYAMHQRLAAAQESERSFRTCFELGPCAAAVLDGYGQLLQTNTRMEAFLVRSRLLERSPSGLLRFRHPATQSRWANAIRALSGTPGAPVQNTFLARPAGGGVIGGLVVHLFALSGAGDASEPRKQGSRILVTVAPLDGQASELQSCRVLRAVLGLTASEARTAVLLHAHHDLEQVAIGMEVAMSTVKTHMKHIFLKTGTVKQSELILLVDRLLMGVASADLPDI